MAAVRRRPRRRGSPKSKSTFVSVNPVFLNLWRDGKEALGCKYYRQRVFRVPSTSNVQL